MGANKQTRKLGRDSAFPRLLAERLCLDFVNTVEGPLSAHPEEFLHTYADLARWARHVGLLSEAESATLVAEAVLQPEAAEVVFAEALALRAALTNLFRAIAHGASPATADLDRVQEAYRAALAHATLTPGATGYRWQWQPAGTALARPTWEVARSAIAVLTEDDLKRVKECPGADDCGWLFYDTSKNGSRRWCSMEGCGSRVKMRHHYARHHGRGAA